MPYVFDTITSRDKPSAASQAANTNRIMGVMLASVRWLFRMATVIIMNRDNIMPSRHRREDIKWDRYISSPMSDMIKARKILM